MVGFQALIVLALLLAWVFRQHRACVQQEQQAGWYRYGLMGVGLGIVLIFAWQCTRPVCVCFASQLDELCIY